LCYRWLANTEFRFTLAGIAQFLLFLTLLAGKKPSNLIAGWDFYFLTVLLASSEERVFFSQES